MLASGCCGAGVGAAAVLVESVFAAAVSRAVDCVSAAAGFAPVAGFVAAGLPPGLGAGDRLLPVSAAALAA